MKKILYLTNIPAPYKVAFFNELAKKVDLTVAFERKTAEGREDDWLKAVDFRFKYIFMNGINSSKEEAFCPNVCLVIARGGYDCVICGGYYSPTAMLAIEYMRLRKIEYYLSTDGGFIKEDSRIVRCIKKHFISGAMGYFSPGKETDKYLIYYGADSKRIKRYPFTSISQEDIEDIKVLKSYKADFKKELNIKEEIVILGVGQFIHRKGWDILLKAVEDIESEIGVYIVGGVANDEYCALAEKAKKANVHFIEFKDKHIIRKFYVASDIFVLPTREDIWGLVINEALSYGIPVITTDKCMAGLEMITDAYNGFVVGTDDYEMLREKINVLIDNEDMRLQLSENAIKIAQNFTIEEMAQSYYKSF